MTQPDSRADRGFSYSRAYFEELVDSALAHAKKLGATDEEVAAVQAALQKSLAQLHVKRRRRV